MRALLDMVLTNNPLWAMRLRRSKDAALRRLERYADAVA
jgi:hypothetical protein